MVALSLPTLIPVAVGRVGHWMAAARSSERARREAAMQVKGQVAADGRAGGVDDADDQS